MDSSSFFNQWSDIWRTVIVGALGYLALVALLRVSGKRTLSKLNAFDLVVTVAMGSILATLLLSRDVSLAEGIVAFGVLILMQFIITWTSVRSERVADLVKARPTLLVYRGEFLDEEMRRSRLLRSEVMAGVRASGLVSMADVTAVVLETDGSLSVISGPEPTDRSTLEHVRGFQSTST